MNVIELMRTAASRREASNHYLRRAAHFDRMEGRFRALHQPFAAEDAHALALMVMRAQIAETDNPEPRE